MESENRLEYKFTPDITVKDSNIKYIQWALDEEYPIEIVVGALVKKVLLNAVEKEGWNRERLFMQDKKSIKNNHYDKVVYLAGMLSQKSNEMLKKYMPRFDNRSIEIKRNPHIAWLCFQHTLNDIFKDGQVNVGRILAYLAFVLNYCKLYLESNQTYLIEDLILKAGEILNTHAGGWIRRNRGWQNIAAFLEDFEI